jgi:hypothetical protein
MDWVVFSYSLPTRLRSSPRVALWRRLGQLGAVSPTGSLYVLPARDECLEAFQWLAQEIRQAKGDAVVMRIEQFEGLSEERLIALFNEARKKEYGELEAELEGLDKASGARKPDRHARVQEALAKFRRRYNDIARVDYFGCPDGMRVAAHFARIEQILSHPAGLDVKIASAAVAEFRDKRWVTRPRPHVDRLACIWLIRRFVDSHAQIRYSLHPAADEIAFDMSEGQFGHQGNLCTFEVLLRAFGLDEPALRAMAEIVHEIDLRDGKYIHPAIVGVDMILQGWLLAGLSDVELEAHGAVLFEGLYQMLSNASRAITQKSKRPRRSKQEG